MKFQTEAETIGSMAHGTVSRTGDLSRVFKDGTRFRDFAISSKLPLTLPGPRGQRSRDRLNKFSGLRCGRV
jgi:hypothetical protein